eukprot:TRINITY_DN37375_c0_g1_i1.p1 TRINITY_DN37375_c0_g1~~TRINITY_DN37375_c0_g1_i1.p1  ORF type:complete len:574 (-),score=99.60 TRINITY_DN37375_c0_g1_i1:53-1774(-)
MTSLADLSAILYKAGPTFDHSTSQYHIKLQYAGTTWEVAKRFSEFDTLLQSLYDGRFGGLPKLPAKTLLGSPTDQAAIDARKEQLRIILQDLLLRPDTRTSQQIRQFLDISSHVTDDIRLIQPSPVRTFEDPRFGVSGVKIATEANLVLVTHEDSTHLSRLGRVWSVVEPDELGALHLWAKDSEGTWKRTFSHTYGIKARSLCWEGTTRQFFVGLEDGKIEVYEVPPGKFKPEAKCTLELHHKSPVTHLSVTSRKLLSVGFDTAMRVIDLRSRELLCGGRLQKRLRNEMDYLTSSHLDDETDRAFIGTSGGDLFILDIARNPPNFLHTVDMVTKPVSALCMSQDSLLVAHFDCISVLGLTPKGEERRMAKLGSYKAKHLHGSEVSILSLTAASERQLIFGGFSDGSVAIWTHRESEAVLVLQAHQEQVSQLVWVENAPWGPALYSGGGDGKVTSWVLNGTPEEYVLWAPASGGPSMLDRAPAPQMASQAPAPTVIGNDTLSAFDPTFEPTFGNGPGFGGGGGYAGGGSTAGDPSDPFAASFSVTGESRRVNPQALKKGDDSDSDQEDIIDAFR